MPGREGLRLGLRRILGDVIAAIEVAQVASPSEIVARRVPDWHVCPGTGWCDLSVVDHRITEQLERGRDGSTGIAQVQAHGQSEPCAGARPEQADALPEHPER